MAEQQTFAVGQVVKFKGYEVSTTEEDQDALLKTGEVVKITDMNKDKGGGLVLTVKPVDTQGTVIEARQGDQLFPEEVEILAMPEAGPAKAAPKAKKGTASKAKKATAKPKAKAAAKPAKKAATKSKTPPAKSKTAAPKVVGPKATGEIRPYHDPHVLELISTQDGDAIKAAQGLVNNQDEIYFTLGGVLQKLTEDGTHIQMGYEDSNKGFLKFVEDHIGNLERRKSYYLIRIYKTFCDAGWTRDDLEGIGWTKARILVDVGEEKLREKKGEWIGKATSLTRADLISEVRNSNVNAQEGANEKIKRTVYKFVLLGDANTMVEQAISHAKGSVDLDVKDRDSAAFEAVCTEYVMLNQDSEGAVLPTDEASLMEYARKRLDLHISVHGNVSDQDAPEEAEETEAT